jgi:hypothetical protein
MPSCLLLPVIPAKAGIQSRKGYRSVILDPRLRGDDGFRVGGEA